MSRDIELIHELERAIGETIEIRKEPPKDSQEYQKFESSLNEVFEEARENNGYIGNFIPYIDFDLFDLADKPVDKLKLAISAFRNGLLRQSSSIDN